jgi:hypothetical protein
MVWTSSTLSGIQRSRWWSSWREWCLYGELHFWTQLIFRVKSSEQLISSEKQSNTANYKFTYSVEIVPVCKDDLVCLHSSQAKAWGNIT